MWRRLTGVRGLAGLRRALLAAALLSLVAMAAAILLPSGESQRWTGAALAALAVLALRWALLFATDRPSWPADAIEAVAIALLSTAIGADNAMPVLLTGLTFRSQYATRSRVLAGGMLYAAAHLIAAGLAHQRFPDYSFVAAVTSVPLLLLVPAAAAELARGLMALEAGAARERALAAAAASYLGATSLKALSGRTAETVQQTIGKRLAALEIVLEPARVDRVRKHFGAGAVELPIAGLGALFALPWEPLPASDRRWLATLTDQFALAAVAQQLRVAAATERIRSLVERTGGVALLVEPDLTIRYATPGTDELFDRQPDELRGRRLVELIHRADLERGREALGACIDGDECAPDRISLRLRGDGEARWAELSVADLRDDDTVGGIVVQMRDITARVALEEDVRRRDDHDPLTGLPNRERFERLVADELRAGNDRLAVVLVDLDQFRVVNETLGHATGDRVLAEVGRRLAYAVAGSGTVARLAGDDFAIVLPGFEGGPAGRDRIERILRALDAPLDAAGTLRLSATAGVVRVDGHHRSPKALLAAAGAALDAAHADGPGSWTLFAPKHHTERIERAMLQAELADGIAAGQLELDYQPVVDAHTGTWRSAEALVRWQHPELGRLGPDRFIALAEQSDLIVALGESVLGEACRQLARWRADGVVGPDFSVAVNVSGVQAGRDDLIDHVQNALAASGLPAAALTLEITETAMVDVEGVAPRLARLRALGVRVAIDDFGTGHSSLAYLKDLPADVVKLPRNFIRDADGSRRGTAIVRGLVGLAKPLGLRVLAEGVETRAQRDCVIAAGCELIQGYLYAAPMRPDHFACLATSAAEASAQRGVGGEHEVRDLGDGGVRGSEIAAARVVL
jgi:diguanylate cyclase (GGDEF)-like protein/PAS domain S-box-containing protein